MARKDETDAAISAARALAMAAQKDVAQWRAHERHTLGGQLCRAAISVGANLVEGRTRRSDKERSRFIEIADGSLRETGYFIGLAAELSLVSPERADVLMALYRSAEEHVSEQRARADALRPTPAPNRREVRATTGKARKRPRSKKTKRGTTLALKPADPFELIRWLARSQSDPRKAVAELVQNSFDAGARHVEVRRRRLERRLCIVVRDDGEGVLPERDREGALKHLATHVGHSHKIRLDPAERTRRVVAGKYGVGLLGFWSIGRILELRTRVGGSKLFALRLVEDSPKAEIVELPLPTDAPDTFTEVVVLDVHAAAQRSLSGRRLADYLTAELRGQLTTRDVALSVHDHVARGLAQKHFDIKPRRFVGERLVITPEVDVPGHCPFRVELYASAGSESPAIEVACAGTLVADDIGQLEALGLDVEPWVGRALTGIIDFPAFNVPPGTRRGVMPDAAAAAFVSALGALAPDVLGELDRMNEERRAASDRNVLRDLRRALRGLRRRLPHFELPEIEGSARANGEAGRGVELSEQAEAADRTAARAMPVTAVAPLFPPGPLSAISISPDVIELEAGGERRVHAKATDRDGRPVSEVNLRWALTDTFGVGVELDGPASPRPVLRAPADAPIAAKLELHVRGESGGIVVEASAQVEVVEPDEDRTALGIPEPHLVNDPAGRWRTRMAGSRWEVNEAHEDYLAFRGDARARLRYLLLLLGRELVLRTNRRPESAEALDALLDILAHAERNLRGR